MYFVFSYLSAQFHSFLKQLRQLGIHHIQLLTDVLQIQFLHLCPSNSSTMELMTCLVYAPGNLRSFSESSFM